VADRARARGSDRVLFLLLVLGVVAGCVVVTFHHQQWGYDDAYISYRYAAHWAAGEGLVFNPGERVEGFSNLLYVLLMGLGLVVLPTDRIYAFSVALNVLCLVAAVAIHLAGVRRRSGREVAFASGVLVAFSPLLWLAAWSGMETCLVLLLFVAACEAVDAAEAGRSAALAPLAGLLVLTVLVRADGFVMAGIAVAHLGLHAFARGRWRPVCIAAAAVAVSVAGLFAFRLAYYGEWLPNTYYAKVSGSLVQRLHYAGRLIATFEPLWPYLLAIGFAASAAAWRSLRRLGDGRIALASIPFEPFFCLVWLGYWFWVGGDVFGMRFLLIFVPVGAAILAGLAVPRLRTAGRGQRVAGALVALGLVLLPFRGLDLVRERTRYDPWETLGYFLGSQHPGALLAVDAAGKIPFYSRLVSIDMYGLSDATIARRELDFVAPGHSKYDVAYVLSRQPDLIAAWIQPAPPHLDLGLSYARYSAAGYRLAYLLYTPPVLPGDTGLSPVVSLAGLSPAEVVSFWRRGYRYGVLVRVGGGPQLSPAGRRPGDA